MSTQREIDLTTIEAAQAASFFYISIWIDRARGHFRSRAWTLPEARKLAGMIEAKVANGREAVVYACTPDGRIMLVPAKLDGEILATMERGNA